MAQQIKPSYCFGPFVLDVAERRLSREGRQISLTPKAFDTLTLLVENAGHALDKEEMLRRLWPETFVEEATLAKNISLLRKALGDGEEGNRYIQTIPKFGYRFDMAVQPVEAPAPVPARRRAIAHAGWVVLAIGVAVLTYSGWRLTRPPVTPAEKLKLAVLPFENLSGDPAQDYLSEGMTEEMIGQLARLNPERLAVIARTSAMHFKASAKTVAEFGRELGADYVLEGSLRREGDRLRISARLVQVDDQTHLWAQQYERDVGDLIVVQDEVARAIASEIRVQLTAEPPAAGPATGLSAVSSEVHQQYLKGRYFWNKRTEAGYRKAIEYFDQAIEGDPGYAPAYAGLADAYALLGSMTNSTLPRLEAMPRARAFAEKALALDESLAEAHASLAFVKMHFEHDWAGAEREFQRAIALNPSYVTAHHWYAYCLIAQSRVDEALREIRLAHELDPLSLIINTDVAEMLYFARRYDDAIRQAQRTLEMDPSFALAQRILGLSYEEKGMYKESIAVFQALVRISGRADYALAALGRSYALSGNRQEAEDLLHELLALKPTNSGAHLGPAILYAALGNNDEALTWLEKLTEQRAGIILIRVEPYFDSLRTEPRFQMLVRRLGLNDTAAGPAMVSSAAQ